MLDLWLFPNLSDMARLHILLVTICLLLSGMNMISLCRWRMIITSCQGVCGLNILVLHPLYAGSHVLTLHSLRNTSDILMVTIIAFLVGFQAINKTFCHLLLALCSKLNLLLEISLDSLETHHEIYRNTAIRCRDMGMK